MPFVGFYKNVGSVLYKRIAQLSSRAAVERLGALLRIPEVSTPRPAPVLRLGDADFFQWVCEFLDFAC
jgi:hypothetical protein